MKIGLIIAFTVLASSQILANPISMTRVQQILNQNSCMGCHGAGSSSGDFATPTTPQSWAQTSFISPGDPDNSSLYYRLKNYGNNGSVNNMPRGAGALSSADYRDLRIWIENINPVQSAPIDNSTETDAKIGINPNSIEAQKIIFKKCYEQLTRMPYNPQIALARSVHSGSATGPEACSSLLRMARLTQNSRTRVSNNSIARNIFDTLFEFHISWLGSRDFNQAISLGSAFQESIHDLDQPALYLSHALHRTDIPFSSIFTTSRSLKAIRRTSSNNTNDTYLDDVDFFMGNGQLVTRGNLIGITTYSRDMVAENLGPLRQTRRIAQPSDIHKNHGAGILGSQSYLMLNSGSHGVHFSNGGLRTKRNLSENFFKQFLCRELPLVRPQDALAYVSPTSDSPLPYRNGVSCMRCHSSIDPFAWSARNIYLTRTDGDSTNNRNRSNLRVQFAHAFQGNLNEDSPVDQWPDNEPNFYQNGPWGKLYYRSFNGDLIDEEVRGINELGLSISRQDDPYVCAASKYFSYFTGVHVNLDDIDHTFSETQLSNKERSYRNFVIKMGRELKEHQDLEKLFERIFSSKAYIAPGLGVE